MRSLRWWTASAVLALVLYAGMRVQDGAARADEAAEPREALPSPVSEALGSPHRPRATGAPSAPRANAAMAPEAAPALVEGETLEEALDTWATEMASLAELPAEEQARLARSVTAPLARRVEVLESAGGEDELLILREEARTGACDADVPAQQKAYYVALGRALQMTDEALCAVSRVHYEIP